MVTIANILSFVKLTCRQSFPWKVLCVKRKGEKIHREGFSMHSFTPAHHTLQITVCRFFLFCNEKTFFSLTLPPHIFFLCLFITGRRRKPPFESKIRSHVICQVQIKMVSFMAILCQSKNVLHLEQKVSFYYLVCALRILSPFFNQ